MEPRQSHAAKVDALMSPEGSCCVACPGRAKIAKNARGGQANLDSEYIRCKTTMVGNILFVYQNWLFGPINAVYTTGQ